MKYTTLGNTGLVVSRLSFGAMTFGSDPSIPSVYKVSLDDARKMIDTSLAAGINFFDTADGYAGGQSEEMLGRLLADRRQEAVIATKVGFRNGTPITQSGLSRRHILYSCEQSLKRLGTDYIDLYIVHREDPVTPLEETLETLDSLVKSGKVRYIGFSNWSVWKSAIAWQMQRDNGWATFCNGQMNYTLVGRDAEHDITPFMLHAGIGMTVWGPLAGGFLSGKYTRENLKDENNRLSGFDLLPFDKEKGFVLLDRLKEIAATHNATPAQISLSWLLTKRVVSSVIIGASKLHQLEDNLKAATINLTAAEIEMLNNLSQPTPMYPQWFNQQLADPAHKAAGLVGA
ncbi:aldo/keto reductase [Chitinophaga polysaccharea]|uniref:aldo/keto reductase n=1 Tax=Chitinophaga TaxID=79328 RepID=UPI001455C2B0|nr:MULTISPECIES: aldo/keto reductase [Chitinophaga]NLR61057.1 aldo/keto reductase [Chitinophaga polysaccharea]NLU96266.1 aldo/keto reductase [Chitinophaga sp. Ak27]